LAHKFPCPKCGAEIPVGQAYCTSCGERFEYKAPGEVQISQPPPVMPPQPIMVPPHGHHRHGFWAFWGIVGAILCLGVVFFLVITGGGSEPIGSGKGFSLKQSSPGPSAPPIIRPVPEDAPIAEDEPVEVTGSSRYSKEQVIAVAKRVSPECRRDKYG